MPDSNALPDLTGVPLRDLRADNPVLDAAVQRLIKESDRDGEAISAFSSGPPEPDTED